MDRLVCADGGNPDPTSTHGKDAPKAKQLELDGWDYPRHLAGRLFAVVVHGDVERRRERCGAPHRLASAMQLIPAGAKAELDRYIGYYEPYATSHEALDEDEAFQEEVRNAARTLVEAVKARRAGPADRGRGWPEGAAAQIVHQAGRIARLPLQAEFAPRPVGAERLDEAALALGDDRRSFRPARRRPDWSAPWRSAESPARSLPSGDSTATVPFRIRAT